MLIDLQTQIRRTCEARNLAKVNGKVELVAELEAKLADLRCECPEDASGPWDCCDCPTHGAEAQAEMQAQYESEMAAENAWLVHAENQGFYDDPRGD